MKRLRIFLGLIVFCSFLANGALAYGVEIRSFPVPQTVSDKLKPLIAAKPFPWWSNPPKTNEEWKNWSNSLAKITVSLLPALREKMNVEVKEDILGGVRVFELTPKTVAKENEDKILLHLHEGGYVLNPGEAGTFEAVYMAGFGKVRVISADYRMPPDFPYPAAMDDAMSVYKALLKKYPAKKIGVFGSSTGGGMTLALALRAKAENLPLPGALAPGTPWTDLTKTGDSYFTNEGVDNVLVTYDGWIDGAAKLYAAGHDLRDPMLSPIYGDVTGFPPTLLTSGTRDLFLSNTVRMHLKLREAGCIADLLVFEGMSHAQYYLAPADTPEVKFYFTELGKFFAKYLK